MVSFTSSAINKSGKKFAPKSAPRRAGASSANGSVASKVSLNSVGRNASITPVPESNKADGAPLSSEPDLQRKVDIYQSQHSKGSQAVNGVVSSSSSASEPSPASNQLPSPRSKPDEPAEPTSPADQPFGLQSSATPSATAPQVTSAEFRHLLDVTEADAPETERYSEYTGSQERESAVPTNQNQGHRNDIQLLQSDSSTQQLASSELVELASENVTLDRVDAHGEGNSAPTKRASDATEAREIHRAEFEPITNASRRFRKPHLPRKRSKSSNDCANSETAPAKKPRAKRQREPTPEESEHIEISTTIVKMSDLCKDVRTGKKSKREIELRNLELAEAERKQKAKEEARNSDKRIKQNDENNEQTADDRETTPQKAQAGPKMRIVNGEIVIDNASLRFDRRAEAARDPGDMEDVYESRLSRKINQATYGKRTKAESWDEELTDLFYRGLRMFGTDFMMISKMFPGRSRRQIKLKFNNEERKDPERIKRTLLGPRECIDIQTYSEMTNTVYDDPQLVQRELDEEKKRIEEQHAKEKLAQEELIRNPGGLSSDTNVMQSIEGPLANNTRSRSRKKSATSQIVGGGKEEILGTIDDYP